MCSSDLLKFNITPVSISSCQRFLMCLSRFHSVRVVLLDFHFVVGNLRAGGLDFPAGRKSDFDALPVAGLSLPANGNITILYFF